MGGVKAGREGRRAVRTGKSGRLRQPRGDYPDALRRPAQRSRNIFGRGIGKIPGRRFEPAFMLGQKPFEMMKHHPVEDGPLRMPGTIHSRHGGRRVPANGPTSGLRPDLLEKTLRTRAGYQESRGRMATGVDARPSERGPPRWSSPDGARDGSAAPYSASMIAFREAQGFMAAASFFLSGW